MSNFRRFVIASLLALDVGALHQIPPVPGARGQLREGLHYAARVPAITRPLLTMALVGTYAFEFEVSLPLLARSTPMASSRSNAGTAASYSARNCS